MTLLRIDRLRLLLAAAAVAFALFALPSCDISENNGHTYITFANDTAWAKYDSLDITWMDTSGGAGGTLFQGSPEELKDKNRVEADGYHGQKILILFRGFKNHDLAYEEHRQFDGATGGVTTAIIPIDTNVPQGGLKARAPRLSAILADSLVSIHDSVAFLANALLDSGTLKAYAWDYDGDGKADDSAGLGGSAAVLRGGRRYDVPGSYPVALRVHTADSSAAAVFTVVVLKDEPTADAGDDQTAYPGDQVVLTGNGKDGLGKVARVEWKAGDGSFVEGGTFSFSAPSVPADIACTFRVTDDDSQATEDRMILHVVSRSESNLTGISISSGRLSPQFNPSVLGYLDTVSYEVESVTVTSSGNGDITVSDRPVQSGQVSAAIGLAVGSNPILLTVKVPGTTGKAYQINVVRLPPSADANLEDLVVSAGALDSAFRPEDTLYTIQASNATSSTTVKATLAKATAKLSINGFEVKSGSISGSIPLAIGTNTIKIEVISQGGGKRAYILTVIRAEDGNAELAGLVLSAGAIAPVFTPGVTEYTLSVASDVAATDVTASPERTTSSLTINGQSVTAGKPVSVNLNVGGTLITVVAAAQNGTKKTTSIRVTRAGNGNADLSGLSLSSGELSPVFAADAVFFAATVPNGSKSMDITATVANASSSLAINGQAAVSGKPFPVALAVGANTITLAVTAQNGDKKTYTVSATREKNANADLSGLAISGGSLSPAFAAASLAYSAAVANAATAITVTAHAAESTSTVTVNGAAIDTGTGTLAVNLSVGANSIPVVVTAQSGGTKSYTLTVTRAPNSNANLGSLTASVGPLSPVFDPAVPAYTLAVANAITFTTITPTAGVSTSTLKVNGSAVPSGTASGSLALNVGANVITVQVTAQDSSSKSYTVTVTRATNGNADLSGLTASAGALTPVFAAGTTAYAIAVANTVTSTTVTPTVGVGTTTVKVNGTAVASGSASGAIALNVGANAITVAATAQDATVKTYTVTVTRAANSNANLSGLSVSAGALVPVFAAGTTAYTLAVANSVASTTVTPALAVGTSTVKVNGTIVASGAASGAIALNVGANALTVLVTAQDATTRTYTVTVTRAANANADLGSLAVSAGTLVPAFTAATTAYALTVPYDISAATVTPTTAVGTSTVKVNGTAVASGSASGSIALAVGITTATLLVTAENGTAKTYTVAITRNPGLKIAAGYYHILVLKPDKTLWGAGLNTFGNLGDHTGDDRSTLIPMATDVVAMSAGQYNSVAVKSGGAVIGTGGNYFGALGIPYEIAKCSSFVDIMGSGAKVASGYGHTLFLKTDATVWGSGWNYYGTLGIGTNGVEGGNVNPPVQVMSNVAAIAGGFSHSLFLRTDSTLWAAGENVNGALGNGSNSDVILAAQVMSNVIGMSAGGSFSQILKKDGTLWATGGNSHGELGDGSVVARNTPGQIMSGVASVACGGSHTLILKSDGTLWATGSNANGQLGDGTFNDRSAPFQIMSDVYSIAAGGGISMAVKKNGSLWTWGANANGQLGDGSTSDRNSPNQILP